MSVTLRWVESDEMDRVAEARVLSYAPGRKELAQFQQQVRDEPRSGAGDWLLAETGGQAVGTATSYPLAMWVRGGKVSCQGVAFVGTIRTHRRRVGGQGGVATLVMKEVLRAARERGMVVSALMPFRASYYEHFGYGIVERRKSWNVPLTVLPGGEFESVRFYREGDFEELGKCRERVARAGQCDIERSAAMWRVYLKQAEVGHVVVDREGNGPVRGWMTIENQHVDGLDTVRAWWDFGYEDLATLKRFLHFLASLKDQYRFAAIQLPADLRLNLLLKEQQMTHRVSKNHPNAEARPFTRMQARVLDHKKLIEGMVLPREFSGKAVISVRETEGDVVKFEIDVTEGRAAVKPSDASADVEFSAPVWAMVVLGDLKASAAAELGLISVASAKALPLLDVFASGPAPYCREYF